MSSLKGRSRVCCRGEVDSILLHISEHWAELQHFEARVNDMIDERRRARRKILASLVEGCAFEKQL